MGHIAPASDGAHIARHKNNGYLLSYIYRTTTKSFHTVYISFYSLYAAVYNQQYLDHLFVSSHWYIGH